MIVLDTNVISELMRQTPDANVLRWINAQTATSLFTTTITEAEVMHGVLLLPKGKRRNAIATAATAVFELDLAGRVLAFDSPAANAYAEIMTSRRASGRPMAAFDAQIAAIASIHGAQLATRNTADFADVGLDLVDPWSVTPA